MGGWGGGDERMKARCGYRLKKTGETVDRRQNNGCVKAVSPRHCPATSALRNCCFNCRAGQSQVQCCTAVEEEPEAKEVQLSQPSSTSLLMISSGLTWRSSSTSLLCISWSFDLTWNIDSPGCQYIYWVIPLTLAYPWQYICTFWKQMLNIVTCHSGLPTFCCCCFVFAASSLNLWGWWHVCSFTSQGSLVERVYDCFHFYCQAGGWDLSSRVLLLVWLSCSFSWFFITLSHYAKKIELSDSLYVNVFSFTVIWRCFLSPRKGKTAESKVNILFVSLKFLILLNMEGPCIMKIHRYSLNVLPVLCLLHHQKPTKLHHIPSSTHKFFVVVWYDQTDW